MVYFNVLRWNRQRDAVRKAIQVSAYEQGSSQRPLWSHVERSVSGVAFVFTTSRLPDTKTIFAEQNHGQFQAGSLAIDPNNCGLIIRHREESIGVKVTPNPWAQSSRTQC
jgi:hypothetical protein